jgi:hypothetical protein
LNCSFFVCVFFSFDWWLETSLWLLVVEFGLLVSGSYAGQERKTGAVVARGATLLWIVD